MSNSRALLAIIAAALVLFTIRKAVFMPRGIRLNNPGNIRHSASQWEGMAADQPDPAFVAFESPEYGIRAMAKILLRYQQVYGLHTVAGIINRWAPPVENNTAAYIAHVAQHVGKPADAPLNLASGDDLPRLLGAIIEHENGGQFYTAETIATGATLAWGHAYA